MTKHPPPSLKKEQPYPSEIDKKKSNTMSCHMIVSIVKSLFSFALLGFSLVIVHASIWSNQTSGTSEWSIPSIVGIGLFWLLLFWLAVMEGGQGALVGLQPISNELYRTTHPRAYQNTNIVHNHGDNMERFIIGRQFLVVIVVFLINMIASTVDDGQDDASVLGLSSILKSIFLKSGLALILITITLGQLAAQVNATHCMLDFVNNTFVYSTIYVSLSIEYSGLLHCVYLVQIFFSYVTGKPILHSHTATEEEEEEHEKRKKENHGDKEREETDKVDRQHATISSSTNTKLRRKKQQIFFWLRIVLSTSILGFALVLTVQALCNGQTTMWEGVPSYISILLFLVLMSFVGMMEGMQIATFAVVNMPENAIEESPTAKANCKLVFEGQNFQAFLIGRQICVTVCQFMIARIITIDVGETENNLWDVSDSIQTICFDTGILGAILTTVGASLSWRIIAATFPLAFMSNPFIYIIIRVCLVCERTGICSSAFVLAQCQMYLFKFQTDEHYGIIGNTTATREEDGIDDVDSSNDSEHPSDYGIIHHINNKGSGDHLDLVFIEEGQRTRSESFDSTM